MNMSAPFIRRPIATGVLMAAILLLGLIVYELLPVAALPNIDTPTVLVTAQFPGADAQTVASAVTTPRGQQFGQIPGLTQMTSSSGNESSEICNALAALASILRRRRRSMRLASSRRCQPAHCRLTNSADTPVLMLALTSKTLPLTTVIWQTVPAG